MTGLLIKDFKLLKNQRIYFIVIIAIAVGMALFMENVSFIIWYVTFVGSIFTLSTISYDEFDNGNAFLFSLPITRKNYIMEKYEFGFIIGVSSWLIAAAVTVISCLVRNSYVGQDIIFIALMALPGAIILLAVMLPFQFKFGGERGRIALIGAVGLVYIIMFVSVKAVELFNVDLTPVLGNLEAMSMGTIIAAVWGGTAVVLPISLRISINIMNRKEF